MCYSAMIRNEYAKFVRLFGATMSIKDYFNIFWRRTHEPDAKLKIPKMMEDLFAAPQTDEEREIKSLIDAYRLSEAQKIEQDLFAQRKRLADAERVLAAKPTKAAAESKRIATDKVRRDMGWLADLRRTEPKERDSRIFPGVYAPVIVMEEGRRVVKPMRYQCRPAGKPAFYDTKYPGTFNARRDNLEKFWKGTFGVSHGLLVINAFYENVDRHKVEGRELAPDEKAENTILEFRPRPVQDMLVACVWSRWTGPDQPDLLSFAAITDEPPEEVAAAGHDRCVIPIRPDNVDAWLTPDPRNLAACYDILDDRERPYYEHRMAA